MTCRAPQNHVFRYRQDNVGDPLLSVDERTEVYALELGARSELDALRVETGDGSVVVVAVGAPAVGPFRGPFVVRPFGQIPAYYDESEWTALLQERLPIGELVRHFQQPAAFATKRAPARRTFGGVSLNGNYSTVGEFPIYGRRLTSITLVNTSGTGTVTYKILGRRYRSSLAVRDALDWDDTTGASATTIAGDEVALVLDSSGNTELTFTEATDPVSITIVDEAFDTLEVQAKTSNTNVVRATCETRD